MKRKKILTVIVLLLISAALAFALFVPVIHRDKIEISYSMQTILQQINDAGKLAKWYKPFGDESYQNINIDAAHHKVFSKDEFVEIVKANSFAVELNAGNSDRQEKIVFEVILDSLSQFKSFVTLAYQTTLFHRLSGLNKIETRAEQSLVNLKGYIEDKKRLYGYDIKNIPVTDTSFLYTKKIVRRNEIQQGTKEIFDTLLQVAKEKKAEYNGVRIFHSEALNKDEQELFAAVGVSHRIETNYGDKIHYSMMPYNGNLLSAEYEGPFGNVDKVYNALEQYKDDHKMSSMAIPFQKFLTDGYGFADTQIVKLRVCYPVY